jgi:hypothetical protein
VLQRHKVSTPVKLKSTTHSGIEMSLVPSINEINQRNLV